jgi:PIN domain nuclease of toxin-antitoxin system
MKTMTSAKMKANFSAVVAEYFASFHKLPLIIGHKDPFDRMLIWQAIQSNAILLSADAEFSKYKPSGLSLS